MAGYAVLALTYVMSQFFRAFLAVLTPVLTLELAMTKTELGVASGIFFVTFALMQFKVRLALYRRVDLSAVRGRRRAAVCLGAKQFDGDRRHGIDRHWLLAGPYGVLLSVRAPWRTRTLCLVHHMVCRVWHARQCRGDIAARLCGRDIRLAQAVVEAGAGGGYSGYFTLLKMRWFWPLIPLMLIAYMPPAGIRGLWAGPYLTETFGASAIQIGNVTFFMALGMAIGSFIYGPLEKLTGSARNLILAGNLIQLAVLLWLAFNPPATVLGTGVLFAAIGFFGMTYGLQVAHGRSFLPPDLLGRGVTLINFFNIAGVGIMQIAGGPILEAAKRVSPDGAFQGLFLVYAVAVGISCFAFLFAKNKPQPVFKSPAP
jgi:sugar phosphate permease